MESNKRFRNHISIVVEKLGVLGGIVVAYLIANVNTLSDLVAMGMPSENLVSVFLAGVAILMVLLFVVGYNVAVWSRTWISLVDGSIVIERNTLQKKKNTIGIKNISNVNLEQNLFEMLIGTCKVKLDTNSLSTADQTDVKIVLKKADAEAFRAEVTALLQACELVPEADISTVEQWDYEASTQDIIMHGLFSIRLSVVLIAIGSTTALFVTTLLTLRHSAVAESLGSLLVNIVLFGGMALSAIRNLVMGFLKYYNFKIARRGDKLVMRYGLLKKVHYTIPVRTINGLVVRQSMSARVTGYAMAEIINIGMGDDESEAEAFLCPYSKCDTTLAHIRALLPELTPVVTTAYERQPKGVWLVWAWQLVAVAVVAVALDVGGEWALVYWQMGTVTVNGGALPLDSTLREWVLYGLWGVAICMVFVALLHRVFTYHTAGTQLGERYLLVVNGAFSRRYCWLSYGKVQFIRLIESPPAHLAKIQRGNLHILAQARNQVQKLPYMPLEQAEGLKERILTR